MPWWHSPYTTLTPTFPMSWYLRKGFNFGPFRINYSKHGVGTSFGIPGLRLGIDAEGRTYVHAGRHGLYYKKYLGGKKKSPKTSSSADIHTEPESTEAETPPTYDTPMPPPRDPVPVNSAVKVRTEAYDLAEHLQESKHALRKDVIAALIAAVLIVVLAYGAHVPGYILALVFVPCLLTVITLYRKEIASRSYVLHYTLDREEEEIWNKITASLKPISSCWKLWSLDTLAGLTDELGSSVTPRSEVNVLRNTPPPWVVTNVQVPVISLRGQNLYFLPDGILIETDERYAMVGYRELSYTCGTKRFLEREAPSDAKVLETTWLHTNKDGSRDKRYSYNPSFNICEYGTLHITKDSKTVLRLLLSRRDGAQELARLFSC